MTRPRAIGLIGPAGLASMALAAWAVAQPMSPGTPAGIVHARPWVVAMARTVRTPDDTGAMNRIVARIGGIERIVYETRPGDLGLGEPVVSRDGARLAFFKVDDDGLALYTVGVDRTGLAPILELKPPTALARSTVIGGWLLAWSHDNRTLAIFGLPSGEHWTAVPLGGSPRRTLARVEVATGKVTPLLATGRRVPGHGVGGPVITSQAWAPDDRRLVYMNDDAHAIVLDTATGVEHDLGIGTHPTWSPAGDEVVVQLPGKRGTDGDYVLIAVARPHERTVLVHNPRPAWPPGRPESTPSGYDGPALWSPDARFLALRRLHGEAFQGYLFERSTARVERLGSWFTGESWGGRP